MAAQNIEIERKFLIRPPGAPIASLAGQAIEQGYLADTPLQVRLRRIDGKRFVLTVKSGQGLVRGEHEVELTREQFEKLWPLTAGRRLRKRRYEVPHGERTVEVDVYEGLHAGLIVAEVEFPDEESSRAFEPPDWIGEDVSADLRYSNRSLATE
jgi:CYTH domain-containing protein